MPGIYGPGRSVIDKFKKQEVVEILKEGHFFSRVHVEDIATAIAKSLNKSTPGEIFNICDDLPTESHKVLRYAAKLMNVKNFKSLNFDDPKISSKIKSFYNDNKRVKNAKIKKILHWTPKFRSYKLGLKDIFKSYLNENSSSNITFSKKINGGVERGTLDVAKELAQKKFKSVIFSSGGEMADKYKYKGVEHYTIELEKKRNF